MFCPERRDLIAERYESLVVKTLYGSPPDATHLPALKHKMSYLAPADPLVPVFGHIPITIYTAAELEADPELNRTLVNIINGAFASHKNFKSDKPRFEHENELCQTIGNDGICAVARSAGTIVGSAGLRTWRPQAGGVVDDAFRTRPEDLKLADNGLSYELKAISTVNAPEWRGKGLAGVLTQALVRKVQEDRHPGKDILLWVQLSEAQNGAYWRRRGYEQVGPVEIMPKGTWGSYHDFEFLTMVKRIKPDSRG